MVGTKFFSVISVPRFLEPNRKPIISVSVISVSVILIRFSVNYARPSRTSTAGGADETSA